MAEERPKRDDGREELRKSHDSFPAPAPKPVAGDINTLLGVPKSEPESKPSSDK